MIGADVSPAEINSAPAEIRFARLLLRSYAFQYSTDRPHSAPEQSSVTSPTPAGLPATSSTHAVLAGLPPSKSRLYRSDALERSDHAGNGPHRHAAISTVACSAVPRVDGERGDAAGDRVSCESTDALQHTSRIGVLTFGAAQERAAHHGARVRDAAVVATRRRQQVGLCSETTSVIRPS